MKVLIVEDDAMVSMTVRAALQKEGYECHVASDGEAAVLLYKEQNPDVVILDKGLPRLNGLAVCSHIRQNKANLKDPFILMLTGDSNETDLLVGLRMGADDYMVKPFSPRELVARVYALLRREIRSLGFEAQVLDQAISTPHFMIDPEKREAIFLNSQYHMESLNLSVAEFDLLFAMAKRPGRVWSRDELLDVARGETFIGSDRVIDGVVKRLRKKIGSDFIQTVFGVGYKFEDSYAA